MAVSISTIKRWLDTLDPDGAVAINDGGLTLVELDQNNVETGAYYEVGGIPLNDDEEEQERADEEEQLRRDEKHGLYGNKEDIAN